MPVDQAEFNALREIVRENTGDEMMLLNRFTVRGMRHALGMEQESGIEALVRNGVIVVLITNFIAAWGEWLLANTLTNDQDKRTFPVVIAGAFGGMGQWQWPNIAAVYIVGIMPGLVIFTLTQRWYMKGLQEGALKG